MTRKKIIKALVFLLGIYLMYSTTIAYIYPGTGVHKCILKYQYICCKDMDPEFVCDYTLRVYSDRKYEIQLDGDEVRKALEEHVGEFVMSKKDFSNLMTGIQWRAFFLIPRHIGVGGSDGSESYITVYTATGKHKSGGYNPAPWSLRYLSLEEKIESLTEKNREKFFEEKQKLVNQYYGKIEE